MQCKIQTGLNIFFFERKREQLLVSLFKKDYRSFAKIYKEVWDELNKNKYLYEQDQKAVSQIQNIFKKFKKKIIREVFWAEEIYIKIRKKNSDITKKEIKNPGKVEFDDWFKLLGISQKQYWQVLKTVANFQITKGCSNYCRRCNEWALAGRRKHFSYSAVKRITKDIFESQNSKFVHYSASDPLDWEDCGKNISDLLMFMKKNGYKSEYGFLTKIPKGTEHIAEKLLENDTDMAVSISDINRSRVGKIEKKVNKKFLSHHDSNDLLIPAGLDDDFVSIKSSITDNYGTEITPEGVFNIIPTFTSPLNLTGQCRIKINKETSFFLIGKTGMDGLCVEYFYPLKALNLQGKEFVLPGLLYPQVENLLLDGVVDAAVSPGMMNVYNFFKTFEKDAVKQRKKLVPAVVKTLKKQYYKNRKGSDSNRENVFLLGRDIKNYLDLCSMEKNNRFKKAALSYFLRSIVDYLIIYPDKREIVSYLRKQDKKKYDKIFFDLNLSEEFIQNKYDKLEITTFDLFNIFILRVLNNPLDNLVIDYINRYPSVYNSVKQKYVLIKLQDSAPSRQD